MYLNNPKSALPMTYAVFLMRKLSIFGLVLLVSAFTASNAFAQAEIQVTTSSSSPIEIVSGDTTPNTSDNTDLGTLLPGERSFPSYLIRNLGNQPLTLGGNAVTITGSGASNFSLRNQIPASLAPNGTVELRLLYTPSLSDSAQLKEVTISISNSDSDENPYTFVIRAQTSAPTGPAKIEVRYAGIAIDNGDTTPRPADGTDFGDVPLNGSRQSPNSTSASSPGFRIFNTGGNALVFPAEWLSITSTGPRYFSDRTSGDPTVISPGGSFPIRFRFDADEVGLLNATIAITSTDTSASPYRFDLQGTGLAPPPVATLEAALGDDQSADTGTSYENALVVVAKDADGNTIEGIDVTFTAPSTGASLTTTSLTRRTSATGRATLSSPHANDVVGAFVVTATAGGRSVNFSLENTEPPFIAKEINLRNQRGDLENGAEYDEGQFAVGLGRTIAFQIQNLGTEVLTLGPNPVTIGGPNASNFSLSSQPGTTVAGGSNETLIIQYTPVGSGVKTATVRINNDDADESPFIFTLKIETFAPSSPTEINVTNGAFSIENGDAIPSIFDQTDFGAVVIRDSKLNQSFFINNTGGDLLNIPEGGITVSGANSSEFSLRRSGGINLAASISPSSRLGFDILFAPKGFGLKTATVSIVSNDSDENPYTFALSGFGTAELSVNGGSNQSSAISQPFGAPLTVRALDTRGGAVEGLRVDFTVPSSGARATLNNGFAITNAAGDASISATANAISGSYDVIASAEGSNEVTFSLSNDPDGDRDGVADNVDNCPASSNNNQSDLDNDLVGDACDDDIDGDLVENAIDNCPLVSNADQADADPETPEGDVCEIDELCLPIKAANEKIAVICL